jgi:hypothetical protein
MRPVARGLVAAGVLATLLLAACSGGAAAPKELRVEDAWARETAGTPGETGAVYPRTTG